MSRIGKQPIEVPSGVTVDIKDGKITVKGSKGELKRDIHPKITAKFADNIITVDRIDESKESRSLHGLFRSLISNMVIGVSQGFEKKLEIVGIGYRAMPSGNKITLSLGFSHPIEYKAPEGITFDQDKDKKNIITVQGIDKETVGEVAAVIRSYRKPEPYKGKGIRYVDEYVARKSGKASGSA